VQGGTPLTDVATQAVTAITALGTAIDGLVQAVHDEGCD
jgi:hypothetical protein